MTSLRRSFGHGVSAFGALTLCALAAAGAYAQTAAPSAPASVPARAAADPVPVANDEVVVTARRDLDTEVKAFVEAIRPVGSDVALSRFETRQVCPLTIGVPATQAAAITARLRRVARATGIPVAGDKCVPNVVLAVTQDKVVFIDRLLRERPGMFGLRSGDAIRRLKRTKGPAVAWHIQGLPLTRDGVEPQIDSFTGMIVNTSSRGATRLSEYTRPHFQAAMVVVEAAALNGLTTTQLADYAAMRAYSGIDPANLSGSPSTIATVLEVPMGSAVPLTLTDWDTALLRGLYRAPDNVRANVQRSAIRDSIERSVQGGARD